MQVGICLLTMRLPDSHSLKDKRQVVTSIISRVRNKFNVAIAEVEDNHLWQKLTLGISCVSNDTRHANGILSNVVEYIRDIRPDIELLDYQVEILPGL